MDQPIVMRPVVHVFGGGVAGMTAAHELAERGFRVKVYEPEVDPRDRRESAVGGLARTQWSRVPVLGYPPRLAPELSSGRWMLPTQPLPRLLGQSPQSSDLRPSPLEFAFLERSPDRFDYGAEGQDKFIVRLEQCVAEFAELLRRVTISRPGRPDYVEVLDVEGVVTQEEDVYPEFTVEQDKDLREAFKLAETAKLLPLDEAVARAGIGLVRVNGATMNDFLLKASSLISASICSDFQLPGTVRHRYLSSYRAQYLAGEFLEKLKKCLEFSISGEAMSGERYEWKIVRDGTHVGSVYSIPLGSAHGEDRTRPSQMSRYARLRLRQSLLPGEHGYRFFPSFYRHLRHTMKRIPVFRPERLPIAESTRYLELLRRDPTPMAATGVLVTQVTSDAFVPLERLVPSGRSVHDNLIPLEQYAIARVDADEGPWKMPRIATRSLRGLLTLLRGFQRGMGFSLRDLAWMQVKCLKYLTSCVPRRDRYAEITWYEFLEADGCSEEFKRAMTIWPQALVGLRAHEADARTFGDVAMQLVLDQLNPEGYRDATLNGPTSEAWFDHWRRYLREVQGVEFVVGRLDALTVRVDERPDERTKSIAVHFSATDQSGRTTAGTVDGSEYVVVAVPIVAANELARDCARQAQADGLTAALTGTSLDALASMLDHNGVPFDASILRQAEPKGPLRHFSGVQYYFAQDYAFFEGHAYIADSDLALSAISQGQYRLDPLDRLDGFRGVLSVDIGEWKRLWGSTPAKIADEVFRSMSSGFQGTDAWRKTGSVPLPLWYHVDDYLEFTDAPDVAADPGELRCVLANNRSPYLVNLAGAYRRWPGKRRDYEVEFGRLVFAGTYMKTYTRLVTMESANESARHAVNAILRRHELTAGRVGQLCEVWPLVDREIDDLAFLKKIDAALLRRGLPHMFEILEVERIVDELVPRGGGVEGAAEGQVDVVDKIVGVLEQLTAAQPSSAGAFVLAPLQALLEGLRARR